MSRTRGFHVSTFSGSGGGNRGGAGELPVPHNEGLLSRHRAQLFRAVPRGSAQSGGFGRGFLPDFAGPHAAEEFENRPDFCHSDNRADGSLLGGFPRLFDEK